MQTAGRISYAESTNLSTEIIIKSEPKYIFDAAAADMENGEFENAIKLFKTIIVDHPDSRFALKAKEMVAMLEGNGYEESTEISRTLTKAEIKDTIKTNWNKVKICVGLGKQRNPNLTGKVVVRFIIQETGQVSDATVVLSTINERRTENCLRNRFLSMKFPNFQGSPKTVSYPFIITK